MNQKGYVSSIAVSLVFFWTGFLQADFLPELYEPVSIPKYYNGHIEPAGEYIAPNETLPIYAEKILKHAPQGVYVAVGGADRGLMSILLSTRSTHLLLADYNPRIVRFNRILVALLKVSENREDFHYLRMRSTHRVWKERVKKYESLDLESRRLLMSLPFFDWFRNAHRSGDFHDFLVGPGKGKYNRQAFAGINYLYSEPLFAKARLMAREDRIQSILLNLGDFEAVSRALAGVRQAGLCISVLDLSNAWQAVYLGTEKLRTIIDQFSGYMRTSSLLLLTNQIDVQDSQGAIQFENEFGYIGASFGRIRSGSFEQDRWINYLDQIDSSRSNTPHRVVMPSEISVFNPHISEY
jgi:hypothetical protein